MPEKTCIISISGDEHFVQELTAAIKNLLDEGVDVLLDESGNMPEEVGYSENPDGSLTVTITTEEEE